VREAHRAAVTTALDELERYTQARIGSNHPAENTGKFIAAKFEHDTARPVDGYAAPQLHTHAVIFNVTERADGTTRAVQPQGLFDSQNFATAVYQAELTHRLTRLGYEIEPGRSGAPEIKGYSQEYLDASSPRSRQIREQLEKTGYSSPEAAQIAAHSTRDRKQPLTAEEVLSAHRDMAASFGDQPQQVIAAARVRAIEQQAELTTSAKEAVTFARDKIFEREAVADERMILPAALPCSHAMPARLDCDLALPACELPSSRSYTECPHRAPAPAAVSSAPRLRCTQLAQPSGSLRRRHSESDRPAHHQTLCAVWRSLP
jgi:hypothetical protein